MKSTHDQFPVNILEMNGKIKKEGFKFNYSNFLIYQHGECIESFDEKGEILAEIIDNRLQIKVLDENAAQFMKETFHFSQISTNIDRIIWSKNLTNPESCIVKNEPDILSLFFSSRILVRAAFVVYNPNIHIEFNIADQTSIKNNISIEAKSITKEVIDILNYEDYLLKGKNKFDLEDYEGALTNFDLSISLNSLNPDCYYLRGIAKLRLGDNKGAILDFDNYIDIEPDNAYAFYIRALAKERIKNYLGALKDYSKSIQFDPDDVSSYFNRASIKCTLKDFDGSLQDLTIAIGLAPERSDIKAARELVQENITIERSLSNFKKRNDKKSENLFGKFLNIFRPKKKNT